MLQSAKEVLLDLRAKRVCIANTKHTDTPFARFSETNLRIFSSAASVYLRSYMLLPDVFEDRVEESTVGRER